MLGGLVKFFGSDEPAEAQTADALTWGDEMPSSEEETGGTDAGEDGPDDRE